MKKLSLIAALLLAGCSGGGGDSGTSTPPPPATETDAFFAMVSGTVSTTAEDSEAASVDTMAATSPEASEPSSL